jgi:acetyltransferase
MPRGVPPPAPFDNWTLPDGSAATLRPIRASDMALERAFVRNLSPQSRFARFMSELRELTPDQLYRFTHPDPAREAAYVVIRSTLAGEEEIGVARFVVESEGESAEFAVTVADAWQRKGIGARLMDALLRDARARGLARIEGYVLASNARMLKFVRELGFEVDVSDDDPTVWRVWRAP